MSTPTDRLGHEDLDPIPTGHTPAPWRACDDGRWWTVVAGTSRTRLVARAGTEADARLIAAAPDLLNALALMVTSCPLCSRDVRFVEGVMADGLRCGHCYRARQVLEKAVPS